MAVPGTALGGSLYASTYPNLSDANFAAAVQFGFDANPITGDIWVKHPPTEQRSRAQILELRPLPTMPLHQPGADVTYYQPEEHGTTTVVFQSYRMGLAFSDEFTEDVDTARSIPLFLQDLGVAAASRRRVLIASMLNDAFAGATFQTNRGGALCIATHPIVGGGTRSNLVTGDLAVDTFETALVLLGNQRDWQGRSVGAQGKWLVTAPAAQFLAAKLTKSDGSPEDATRGINPTGMLGITPVTEYELTDADAWFVVSDRHSLMIHDRIGFQVLPLVRDQSRGRMTQSARMRSNVGLVNDLGIVGSAGA